MNTYVVTTTGPTGDSTLIIDTDSREAAVEAFSAKLADLRGRFGYRVREDATDGGSRDVRLRHPKTHQWLTVSLAEV